MTLENLNTTIKSLAIKSVTSLISLLMAIHGRLLSWLLKLKSAELSAPVATESTPSSSKDTTPPKPSNPPSENLPPDSNSTSDAPKNVIQYHYTDPNEFLHDLQRGKLPLRAVTMEQFLLAHAWIAVDNNTPHINKHVMISGGIYDVRMQIASVKYPEEGRLIVGGHQ